MDNGEFSRLCFQVVLLALLYWLECVAPFFPGRNSNHLRHSIRNIALGCINALVVSVFFAGILVAASQWSQAVGFGVLHFLGFSSFWRLVVALLLFDLWMYIWHVINHFVPFLWRFHRVHHSDREMDASTAIRFHPIEIILSMVAKILVVLGLGLRYQELLIYELLLQAVILFHHSNVKIPQKAEQLLRLIFVSPGMHRVHHSQEITETNSNFSSVFSLWDRIFGSYRAHANPNKIALGLLEFPDGAWENVSVMLKTPFKDVDSRRAE